MVQLLINNANERLINELVSYMSMEVECQVFLYSLINIVQDVLEPVFLFVTLQGAFFFPQLHTNTLSFITSRAETTPVALLAPERERGRKVEPGEKPMFIVLRRKNQPAAFCLKPADVSDFSVVGGRMRPNPPRKTLP